MEQPIAPQIGIPMIGDKIFYSRMDIGDMIKLRNFLNQLIEYRKNHDVIFMGTLTVEISEEEPVIVKDAQGIDYGTIKMTCKKIPQED